MKSSQVPFLPLGIAALFVAAVTVSLYGQLRQGDQNRRERFRCPGHQHLRGSWPDPLSAPAQGPPSVEITEACSRSLSSTSHLGRFIALE